MDLPAAVRARRATFDELDADVALLATCEAHDDGAVEIEASDLLSGWRRPAVDVSRATTLVVDGDRVVGVRARDRWSRRLHQVLLNIDRPTPGVPKAVLFNERHVVIACVGPGR